VSFTTRGPRGAHLHPPQRTITTAAARGRRHVVTNTVSLLAGLGLGLALVSEIRLTNSTTFATAGATLTFAGRITAMVGTYGMLLTLFLVARIPLLEREVGLDQTVRWHRKLAPWSLLLISLHVVFTVLGYAMTQQTSALGQFWSLITTTRWVLPATAGFLLLMAAGVTSYRKVRSRMAYETWWVIHLYTYIGVVLSYMHQVMLGNAFVGRALAPKLWLALTVAAIGSLVLFRWVLPIVRGLRRDLRVHAVVDEGPGVVSVWLTGRNLHGMTASGGQFFAWRFLTRDLWWRANPYSLSAPPDGRFLRITVKDLGDHSAAMRHLAPGTRVIAEGPYGAFTAKRRHGDHVVLVAGGVGVTSVRALLEELPHDSVVDVLYRARSHDEVVLKRELDQLAQRPHTTVRYLVGTRRDHPMDAKALLRLAPAIRDSDVFICGPESLREQVRHAAQVIGVPDSHIHDEAFAY
jgi:predicted ferric reductase